MTAPIWFLDVDGVINSIGMPDGNDGVDASSYVKVDVTTSEDITWPIHYSTVVIDFINRVHRTGLAEVRWLTTWQQDARTCFAPAVGLDDFFAYDEVFNLEIPWWKEDVVHCELASMDTPFVWTDDDLEPTIQQRLRKASPCKSLMLQTSPRPGLGTRHLKRIGDFLNRERQTASRDRMS